MSNETDLRSTQLSRGGATLLSSQTGDPGRRRATQREQVRHTADSKGKSQLAASPDFTGPVGQTPPGDEHLDTEQREILADHHWILELCEDDPMAVADSADWTPGWRFLQPGSDVLVVPDERGSPANRYRASLRVTVKVTPRGAPEWALTNTITLSLSAERGRAAAWDFWRVE
jgi:hypothetical protein